VNTYRIRRGTPCDVRRLGSRDWRARLLRRAHADRPATLRRHARIGRTTSPDTSVSRKSRPAYRNVSFS
jgi:hypothetical protein